MTSLCGFENLILPDTTLYAGNEPLKTTDVEHDEDPCSGAVFTDIPIASMSDVDAVALANASSYGLAAHVWTQDLSTAHHTAARLDAGTVFINCILLADPSFPFGGMKRSGIGRENGPEGLEPYLEPKSVVMALS